MRQTVANFFGTKFVVKYWQAKHENRECCPQHGALSAVSAGLAFSAVTIAVSEPFLLPAAENWSTVARQVLARGSQSNSYRQTTMTNGLGRQYGALTGPSARFCLARTGLSRGVAKMALRHPKNPIFHHFRPRNG